MIATLLSHRSVYRMLRVLAGHLPVECPVGFGFGHEWQLLVASGSLRVELRVRSRRRKVLQVASIRLGLFHDNEGLYK